MTCGHRSRARLPDRPLTPLPARSGALRRFAPRSLALTVPPRNASALRLRDVPEAAREAGFCHGVEHGPP
jgi:hypothetical protein